MKDDKEDDNKARLVGTTDDVKEAWRAYTLMEATGWRFLPSQLLSEDEKLLSNVLTIAVQVSDLKVPDHG